MLTAITRAVSRSINRCELTFLDRQQIDFALAREQHRRYEDCLRELGVRVVSLQEEPDYPDAVFVEDPAVVVDEVAVITNLGVESRRGEAESIARALGYFRALMFIAEPGTLEGGDVLRMGRRAFVGLTPRTNASGISALSAVLTPCGYSVETVHLKGCMHLKSGCTALSDTAILANREWIDTSQFNGFEIVDVAAEEPHAGNVLRIGETVVMADCFPKTRAIVERLGYRVKTLDMSELMKAESGVTCSCLLFEAY